MTIAVIGICTVFLCLLLLFGVYSLTGWLFTRKPSGKVEPVEQVAEPAGPSEPEIVLTIDRAANSSNWNPSALKVGGAAGAKVSAAHSRRSSAVVEETAQSEIGVSFDPKKVTSPLPGTVISIDVAKGDSVRKGQKLATIEAMKMENDILAGKDGVIAKICVAKGDTLLEGATIIEFED